MLKVGVFDSGLGGLTVVKALNQVINNAQIFYVADTNNAPYGEKTPEQILQFSLNITQYLVRTYQIDVLVLACNTATSFAIESLRSLYPSLIIVGTEPGIKPAIAQTKTGKIGILATPATLRGDKYQALANTFASQQDITLYEQACPGLVEKIESGYMDGPETRLLLEEWVLPMKDEGVDTIVLGCTHYPLVGTMIRNIMFPELTLIDTGLAIAKRVLSLVDQQGHLNRGHNDIQIEHTGEIQNDMVKTILKSAYTTTTINI